ncbi:unnamed protein product [Phytophthora lilii]|uniref:Unnamed protein product n=1 Tax=Phytophthora lilii TaxID=2077276 RepID=A0A9W6WKX8_9STRA|nr:unnamed protein product [Phytophthora lilii]
MMVAYPRPRVPLRLSTLLPVKAEAVVLFHGGWDRQQVELQQWSVQDTMKGERLRVAFGANDCQFNTSNAFDWDLVVPSTRDRTSTCRDVRKLLGFVRHVTRTSRVDGPSGIQKDGCFGCETHWVD